MVTDPEELKTLKKLNRLTEVVYSTMNEAESDELTHCTTRLTPSGEENKAGSAPRSDVNINVKTDIELVATAQRSSLLNVVLKDLQTKQIRRIAAAQSEQLRWHNLKLFLKGDMSSLTLNEFQQCAIEADLFKNLAKDLPDYTKYRGKAQNS